MARGKFINFLCRLFCLRCYSGENLPSGPLPLPVENRADENHSSDPPPFHPPPPFPCGVHDGTATGSCTCGLATLGDGSVDFYKFEEKLRALLRFDKWLSQAQSDPEKGLPIDSVQQEKESSEVRVGAARFFSVDELWKAVRFFDPVRILGAGGYGNVYLGKLEDGRMVAVKVMHVNDTIEQVKFIEEIDNLCNLRHPNLVTLYGFTYRFGVLLLAYEYVTNGNVAQHIHEHGEAGRKVLTWDLRMQIAVETAEALSFLHFHPGRLSIIHCDVKTDNIMLDDNFHAKVCDFGLSSKRISSRRGTLGYLDPEFDKVGRLTTKSDVYSFGVVLLELISGQKAVDVLRPGIYLDSLALDLIANKQLDQLVDRNIGYQSDPEIRRMVNLVADLACFCLRSEGNKRPSMQTVVWNLKGIRDNKDHIFELIDYTSPDQAPTDDTVDISNVVQLVRRRMVNLVANLACFRLRSEGNKRPSMQEVVRKLKSIKDNKGHGIEHIDYSSPDQAPTDRTVDISNIVQLVRRVFSLGFTEALRNSSDHKLSTVFLFVCFSIPGSHGPSCSCRRYLQDDRILQGLASSPCFLGAVCTYIDILAAIDEIPLQVAQRISNYAVTLKAALQAKIRQLSSG